MHLTSINHNTTSLTNLSPKFMGSESIAALTVSKSSSSSGEKLFPPGFRFHPTDEELILYYLKQKIRGRSLKLDIIGEIDVLKWEPEELPGLAKWKTGDRQWFFFTHRDRKYPNGGRSNRGTMQGYWKATGKDRVIKHNSRLVGLKKTLVYYLGRAPNGKRTDWVMHEYAMDEEEVKRCKNVQELYTLCKVFKKSGPGPKNGEEYGAVFVEEEWSDDENVLDVESLLVKNINTVVSEPKLTSVTMVEPEIVQPMAQCNPVNVVNSPSREQLEMQPGCDVGQSAKEPSEITCVNEVPQPLVVNEDFLELDDLRGPQPAFQINELPMFDDFQFGGFEHFCAFEFYNDSTEFIQMHPFNSEQSQPYYTNNLDCGMENPGVNSYSNDYNLWSHDQETVDVAHNMRATDGTNSAPSGLNEKSGNPDSSVNQNRKTREDDEMDSWFSSALWAFVESVPTSPASALESSALANKAFDLVPSFGRISNADGAVTLVTRRVKRSSRSKRVLFTFLFLEYYALYYVYF